MNERTYTLTAKIPSRKAEITLSTQCDSAHLESTIQELERIVEESDERAYEQHVKEVRKQEDFLGIPHVED